MSTSSASCFRPAIFFGRAGVLWGKERCPVGDLQVERPFIFGDHHRTPAGAESRVMVRVDVVSSSKVITIVTTVVPAGTRMVML